MAGHPGWYFGIQGFYSDVDDLDGDLKIVTPETTTGTPNDCLLTLRLLGLDQALPPLLSPQLCILGDNSTLEINPGSSVRTSSNIRMDAGAAGGFTIGYAFDGGLRPELDFTYAESDIKRIDSGNTSVDGDGSTLTAMRLMGNVWLDLDFGDFAPYVGGGFGMQNTELDTSETADDDTFAYQFGGGLAFWFNPQLALSLDYRYIVAEEAKFKFDEAASGVTATRDGEYQAQNIGASLRYSFGAEGKDSDGDGIPDLKDRCPNTPPGVQVYSDGCPVDLDQDGVPDYLDKCPGTPPGSPVDANGCPLDSDADGVPDHLDQCPGTPVGVKVDTKGCPLDSDGDGIPDSLDQCPGTVRGQAVDAKGCPITDSDGDGIPDYLDKCPSSPKGSKVGPDGCPLDSDGDGIPDDQDECPHTPKGLKVLPNGCALEGDCRTPRPGEQVDANGCAVDQRFILRGVKFELDSDRLTKPSEEILNGVADTLAFYPKVTVEVSGHTDNVGTDAYNLGLSERRSNSVKRYLTSRGVAADRMRPFGYGESAPIESNDTEEGREENRRVEFKVLQK
jgi:outer membrane protein OmpA-like peptidoglycan-associated protein/opacity protein-like surface antigen